MWNPRRMKWASPSLRCSETFWFTLLPFQGLIERLPLPVLRRGRASRGRLDALIYSMIDERRAAGRDHGDLLSMLLAVRDDQRQGLSLLTPQRDSRRGASPSSWPVTKPPRTR